MNLLGFRYEFLFSVLLHNPLDPRSRGLSNPLAFLDKIENKNSKLI